MPVLAWLTPNMSWTTNSVDVKSTDEHPICIARSWDNVFGCDFKGRYDLREGSCSCLADQQVYIVSDNSDPENSQMRLVLGGSVTG